MTENNVKLGFSPLVFYLLELVLQDLRGMKSKINQCKLQFIQSQAAVVHLNFRAMSTVPVPVFTVPSSMNRTSRCNKVDAVRLFASYRLNLLLLKGQRTEKQTEKNFTI